MSIINSQPLIGASGNQSTAYNLTRSLRFRSSASAYLNRTPSSAGNRRTWTWSAWVKRGILGSRHQLFSAAGASTNTYIEFQSDQIMIEDYNPGVNMILRTTAVQRDPSAWYHFVVAVDTTQATSSNRIKIYINGVQQTAFASSTYPSQNYDTAVNSAVVHKIGQFPTSSSENFDGYMAEVNFIDGQALTPSDFGETDTATGVWKPKKYTGTYGTNGFYLKFDNLTSTSTLGNDSSGNSNTWTVNNISLTSGSTYDSMKDVPTLTDADTANYAVQNPVDTGSASTLSNGNLQYTKSSGSNWDGSGSRGTFGVSSGKWYWEATVATAVTNMMVGVNLNSASLSSAFSSPSDSWTYYKTGTKFGNGSGDVSYGASYAVNDVIGIALDMDSGTLTFYKNNTSQGTAFNTGLSTKTVFPLVACAEAGSWIVNFGQRPFSYTPPSGYVALNTFNLPTPTIGATASTQANDYFDVSLWTGNGSTQSITNSGSMQPDFVWIKGRNAAWGHRLADAVRGVGKELFSNDTSAELTNNSGGYLTAFNSNGFSINSGAGVNTNNDTYVGWQWKANGAGSSNTAGTITSTVSANTTAGFSIVSYTTQSSGTGTVGHGLGAAPSLIILKNRALNNNWIVYHTSLGASAYLYLNTTAASVSDSSVFNGTNPTSTVFSMGTGLAGSISTIAYCFAEVAGYSAFGSYTGNGSTDGPFVFCGFRPKFVMTKASSSVTNGHWIIKDTARDSRNLTVASLYPNLSNAEDTVDTAAIDILSNGFKIRGAFNGINNSGSSYIYIAFAENPFKYSLAR